MEGASRSLRALAEEEVLDGILEAAKGLQSPFAVAGTREQLPVRLAVQSAEGSGGGGGDGATIIELPGSGEGLEALLAQCAPAVFGKGKKTGMWSPLDRGRGPYLLALPRPYTSCLSCRSHRPTGRRPSAVRDDSYRCALALPASRLFTQDLEAAHLSGVLAAVGRLLLPAAGPLSAKLHALNVYQTGGWVSANVPALLPTPPPSPRSACFWRTPALVPWQADSSSPTGIPPAGTQVRQRCMQRPITWGVARCIDVQLVPP